MRVAITGSTGLIGEALVASLLGADHEVVRLTRSTERAGTVDGRERWVHWDPIGGEVDPGAFVGVDAVVHLAGEPIGAARWTDEVRRRIHESRQLGTRTLAEALASLADPPAVLVSGSAVGYYGDRGSEVLDETADAGQDFLAEVCVAWEGAADPARDAGIRVVHPRTGVVIAAGGPLIDKVELPFKLGVGGRIGNGWQYVPWIALEDEVRAIEFLLEADLAGPVNLTAPEPVTNRALTAALGEVVRRPTVLPIPPLAISMLYGEMGRTLATVSQRAVPRRLLDAGFRFTHTDLVGALRVALDRSGA